MDDDSDKKVIGVEVDPNETSLEDLLKMAEVNDAGTLSVHGEREDGTIQWGIIVVCCDDAGEMMDNLQKTIESTAALWRSRRMN